MNISLSFYMTIVVCFILYYCLFFLFSSYIM